MRKAARLRKSSVNVRCNSDESLDANAVLTIDLGHLSRAEAPPWVVFLEQLAARNYNIDLSRIDPSCVAAILFRLS